VLHWLIAIVLLGQFAFGWWLNDIPRNTPARGYFVNRHKSTGITIALLILLRLYWRVGHSPPPGWDFFENLAAPVLDVASLPF
jgi:cytochrome b561